MRNRRNWLHAAGLMLFGTLVATQAIAQSADGFPNRPVKIVVPYAAGGGFDIYTRALAPGLAELWKQSVIVENRPGGNEILAAESVKQSAPDGYTLMLVSDAGMVNNPILVPKLSYSVQRDFALVTRLFDGKSVLVVRSSLPVNSLKEYIAYAKSSGGKANYGSSGIGSSGHITLAWMANHANVPLTHVPYKGSAPIIQDMITGVVDATLAPLGLVDAFIRSGQIRPIAVTGDKRIKSLPNVPSVHETGDGLYDYRFFVGLAAPAQTPTAIVEKLAADIRTVACSQAFRERNTEPFGYDAVCDTPGEFSAFLGPYTEQRRQRVEAAKLKPE